MSPVDCVAESGSGAVEGMMIGLMFSTLRWIKVMAARAASKTAQGSDQLQTRAVFVHRLFLATILPI
jgi:hypothetical protein